MICLWEGSFLVCVACVCLRIVVSNTYRVIFTFCLVVLYALCRQFLPIVHFLIASSVFSNVYFILATMKIMYKQWLSTLPPISSNPNSGFGQAHTCDGVKWIIGSQYCKVNLSDTLFLLYWIYIGIVDAYYIYSADCVLFFAMC
jgi:hypothetical protein